MYNTLSLCSSLSDAVDDMGIDDTVVASGTVVVGEAVVAVAVAVVVKDTDVCISIIVSNFQSTFVSSFGSTFGLFYYYWNVLPLCIDPFYSNIFFSFLD